MSEENLETQNDQLNDQETADPIDTQQETVNVEPQNTAPAFDMGALYRDSLAERRRLEAEIEALRQAQQRTPQHEEIEVTDEFFEKHGTAKGVKTIVESVIAKQLRESLGDIGELSQDFKRTKQINSAEEKFFQEFPQLISYRDQLAPTVRQFVSNAPNVDVNTYRQVALSAIGALTVQNLTQQNNAPAPTNSNVAPTSTPTPRTASAPVRTPVRRLSELERTAMRNSGYDPNKREDIDAFFAIVENDEGVTV